ncbi:MAG: glycoside hydrolase family 127 protein [Acidobacteriota bacterium]
MTADNGIDRRTFLHLAAAAPIAAGLVDIGLARTADTAFPAKASPFPLEAVRLLRSPFLDAVNANQRYLHKIEPDRLLHNFRVHAGLKPKGDAYGGWEADTIAGHSLGHYLTACSLMYAQTGDPESKKRVDYIVSELVECQKAAGDGYAAGFTRRKGDKIEDGRVVFEEIKRGEIRSSGFDLNGSWVPLYNWHKLFSGLFEANTHCSSSQALKVAVDLGGYIDGVFSKINDEQLQKVLNCEQGGINESFAELYSRTNDKRWLALAERIRHHRTLDPIFAQQNKLSGLHANTQIPKIIGLARLFELTGKSEYSTAAKFFWDTVTSKYSYVIGGNSDREHFQEPNTIARYITDQTCESCNTYNMLKLTRHLFAWNPQGSYFDYYERAHFNHMLAQQNPKTGMFAYMVPLMSGSARAFSTEFNDFWCCVGSGMETHSKHGESIYWRADDVLFVNLFIPSTLEWKARGAAFEMTTDYPLSGRINVKITKLPKPATFDIAMRLPSWADKPAITATGSLIQMLHYNGYAMIRKRWKQGDVLTLDLKMEPRLEATAGDDNVVAVMSGPLVLAADLGDAAKDFNGVEPAFVGGDLKAAIKPTTEAAVFMTTGIGRPADISLKPFYSQWERRTAVYFPRYTDQEWAKAQAVLAIEQARNRDIMANAVDMIDLGNEKSEKEHKLTSSISYPLSYRAKNGRDARTGGYFEFQMKVADVPLTLRARYWGEESKRSFNILIDGQKIATETLGLGKPGTFVEIEYLIPVELLKGKADVTVRFEPEKGSTAGPVFGCLIYKGK